MITISQMFITSFLKHCKEMEKQREKLREKERWVRRSSSSLLLSISCVSQEIKSSVKSKLLKAFLGCPKSSAQVEMTGNVCHGVTKPPSPQHTDDGLVKSEGWQKTASAIPIAENTVYGAVQSPPTVTESDMTENVCYGLRPVPTLVAQSEYASIPTWSVRSRLGQWFPLIEQRPITMPTIWLSDPEPQNYML